MRSADLPIFEIESRLLETLAKQKRVVLTAPTGSGKSTQVPQMMLEAGLLQDGQVVVLQPRRLPTRMLAAWVAQARDVSLGAEVGYQMRLDSVTSRATRICYTTEGVLLRRMLADPALEGVNAIVFDEFHERHLYGDITLARALQIQETTRPDLILLVASATLDVGQIVMLQKYLDPCALLSAHGRAYPVAVEYLPKPTGGEPVWELAVRELQRLIGRHRQGDALVFMPGAYEITRTVQVARDALGPEFVVFPLHGALPPMDQDAAVARYDRRKIIVATNVAETSLTIDGVCLVIDSGLARIPRHDPYRGINTLLVEKISRAAADQRAGRAGRIAPGHCVRLWTAHEHSGRPAQELPEVKRLDLAEAILTLKGGGVKETTSFRWFEAPDPPALERAETLLRDLGALDDTGAISALGRRMLAFPAHPRYARMLLAANEFGCVRPMALIAALTQGRDLLIRREENQVKNGSDALFDDSAGSDFFLLMRAWRYAERNGYHVERCRRIGVHAQAARQVEPLFEHLLSIAAAEGLDIGEKPVTPETVQRCVLLGFSDQLAKRLNPGSSRCALVHGRRGLLARESVVKAPLFVVSEAREVESGGRDRGLTVMLKLATAVQKSWLREYFPRDFKAVRAVIYDPSLRRVVARDEIRFRDLVLVEKFSENPPVDEAAMLLAREVAAGRCALANWNETVEQWILRVNRLRAWMPELELPVIGAEDRHAVLEHICHGALTYNEIRNRPVLPIVKSWLSRQQQMWIEDYAPERIELPGGRKVNVCYSPGDAPTIAARIQDLYGVKDGLWIAAGRVAVRIQVLAPNNRPVQVTENLEVFWREAYPKLKRELRRKYPRHEWR